MLRFATAVVTTAAFLSSWSVVDAGPLDTTEPLSVQKEDILLNGREAMDEALNFERDILHAALSSTDGNSEIQVRDTHHALLATESFSESYSSGEHSEETMDGVLTNFNALVKNIIEAKARLFRTVFVGPEKGPSTGIAKQGRNLLMSLSQVVPRELTKFVSLISNILMKVMKLQEQGGRIINQIVSFKLSLVRTKLMLIKRIFRFLRCKILCPIIGIIVPNEKGKCEREAKCDSFGIRNDQINQDDLLSAFSLKDVISVLSNEVDSSVFKHESTNFGVASHAEFQQPAVLSISSSASHDAFGASGFDNSQPALTFTEHHSGSSSSSASHDAFGASSFDNSHPVSTFTEQHSGSSSAFGGSEQFGPGNTFVITNFEEPKEHKAVVSTGPSDNNDHSSSSFFTPAFQTSSTFSSGHSNSDFADEKQTNHVNNFVTSKFEASTDDKQSAVSTFQSSSAFDNTAQQLESAYKSFQSFSATESEDEVAPVSTYSVNPSTVQSSSVSSPDTYSVSSQESTDNDRTFVADFLDSISRDQSSSFDNKDAKITEASGPRS